MHLGRGTAGVEPDGNWQYPNNIKPDTWDDPTVRDKWNWGSFATESKEMTKADDGTYYFTWIFQTNTGGTGTAGFLMDSLEINGTPLNIPFVPTTVAGTLTGLPEENANPEKSYTITELPDGAQVKIEYVRVWGSGIRQRVYKITVTGARTNITITGGNLMMLGGGPEIIPYTLTGVDTLTSGGNFYKQSAPIVNCTNIEFKLMDCYKDPKVKLTDVEGNDCTRYIEVLANDNGYYITGFNTFLSEYRLGLLTITATPIKYAVQYTNGGLDSAELNTTFDNNGGNYYTIENSKVITISEQIPKDGSGDKVFDSWKNENISSPITPGEVFEIIDVDKLAKDNGNGIHVLTLDAGWNEAPKLIDYNIILQWEDKDGKTQEEALQHILTQNYVKDGALDIVVNKNAKILLDWLAQNPKYSLSDKNGDYVYENVYDQDTVYIYLEEIPIEDNNGENDQDNNGENDQGNNSDNDPSNNGENDQSNNSDNDESDNGENDQDNNSIGDILTAISPFTGDNIIIYFVILVVSITLLIGTRKLNKNKNKGKHF